MELPVTALADAAVAPSTSRKAVWAGRVASGVVVALLSLDALVKVFALPPAVEGTVHVGFSPTVVVPLGIVLLASVVAYAIPRTSFVGALFVTGYLGGAVATHVRMGDPLFSHVLAPIYVAIFLWGGLFLRDERVRALVRGRAA